MRIRPAFSLPVMALNWDQALAWRLRRHLLDPVGACSVRDVVGRLAAVPAHPETTPELAIGLRRTGARAGDVGRALDAVEPECLGWAMASPLFAV